MAGSDEVFFDRVLARLGLLGRDEMYAFEPTEPVDSKTWLKHRQ